MREYEIEYPLGVVIAVDSDISTIGLYNVANESRFIIDGEIIAGIQVGAFAIVKQGRIRIVSKIIAEKVVDQQNSTNSKEFDNRFHASTIQRIIKVKAQGVIVDGRFNVTTSNTPMVGNEIVSATPEDLSHIFSLGVGESESIPIGETLLEKIPIRIPINQFFASHIGIVGNTGSGKSNTLHKIFLELSRNKKHGKYAFSKSKFFVIDYNGEYTESNVFQGVPDKHSYVMGIDERTAEDKKFYSKIPIPYHFLFSIDILKTIVNATESTQVPFLQRTLRLWIDIDEKHNSDFGKMQIGLLKSLLSRGASAFDLLQSWIDIAYDFISAKDILNQVMSVEKRNTGNLSFRDINGNVQFLNGNDLSDAEEQGLHISEITESLNDKFNSMNRDPLGRFLVLCRFQKVYYGLCGNNPEFISPLITRMQNKFGVLRSYLEIADSDQSAWNKYGNLNVISLSVAEYLAKQSIPILLSKFIYSYQKNRSNKQFTTHLIIDEAHNILSSPSRNNVNVWEDYRIKTFEEIVKEGRKFGFFLTISSQRPADISPTIMSQIHNYVIHRLVNDKDLEMMDKTMPTLDAYSKAKIPSLGKGEAVLTGTAFGMPSLIKIPLEIESRPNSDDIVLTDIWSN